MSEKLLKAIERLTDQPDSADEENAKLRRRLEG